MNDIDIIPGFKIPSDRGVRRFIGSAQIGQRFAGENYSPAKRVVGAVALVDGDLVRRVGLLHQQAEVEPGRAPADRDDPHRLDSKATRRAFER